MSFTPGHRCLDLRFSVFAEELTRDVLEFEHIFPSYQSVILMTTHETRHSADKQTISVAAVTAP